MTDIFRLKDRFEKAMRRLGANDNTSAAFDQLVEDYKKPPRFYHTIDHVSDVLDHLDFAAKNVSEIKAMEAGEKQTFLDTVELAIWYHDIVYDATRHDNEALSADNMAAAAGKLGIDAHVIQEAKNAILITAHHPDAKTLSEKVIVDCDLHVLGVVWEKFANNSALIKKEYAHVPDDIYVAERAKALTKFLAKGDIYKTDAFRTKYEKQAQDNIRRLAHDAPPSSFKK